MQKRALLAAALVLTLALPALAAAPPFAPVTLRGSYVWEQGDEEGRLEAEFTPTDEHRYRVVFRFERGGASHTYEGTAEGSLEQGTLRGRVQSDRRRRTFSFSGVVKDGKFTGTHAEGEGIGEQRTGTLSLG